jgi:hypothetical protein
MSKGENRSTSSVTLSTTNPTCIGLGLNMGLSGERPSTNRTALSFLIPAESNVNRVITR